MYDNFFQFNINPVNIYFETYKYPFINMGGRIELEPRNVVFPREFSYEMGQCAAFPEYQQLASDFKNNFGDHFELLDNTKPFCPVLTITFILSLYIAVNDQYREAFYLYFQNETVPSITAFVLENVQAGLQNKDLLIEDVCLGEEHGFTHRAEGLIGTLFNYQLFGDAKGRSLILAWFTKLNSYNQGNCLFASTVLTKKSLYQNKIGGSPLLCLSTEFPESGAEGFDDPYSSYNTEPTVRICYYFQRQWICSTQ